MWTGGDGSIGYVSPKGKGERKGKEREGRNLKCMPEELDRELLRDCYEKK